MNIDTRPYLVVIADNGVGYGVRGPGDFVEWGHRRFDLALDRALSLRRQRLWMAADGVAVDGLAENEEAVNSEKGEWDDDVNSPGTPGNQTIPETKVGEMVRDSTGGLAATSYAAKTGFASDDDEEESDGEGANAGRNKIEQINEANFSEVDPNKSKSIKVPSSEEESNATHVKDPNEGKDPFREVSGAKDGETHQAFAQANTHAKKSEPHHTPPVPYMAGSNPNHPGSVGAPDNVNMSANQGAAMQQSGLAPGMTSDPMASQAQRAAMHAAAAGHSNIGIPESVGQKFAAHDPGGKLPAHAADFAQHLRNCRMDERTVMDACRMAFGDCHY